MSVATADIIDLIKQKRGWSEDDIQQFMTPTESDLHDPFLLEHMSTFVDELHTYKDQWVTILPDYDADGILSGSLLAASLSQFGFEHVNVYTPRIQTGYGISEKSAKEALTRFPDTDVIVTTDNGSNAFDGIRYANEQGVPVLVTDHHKAGETDPTPVAVNPNRPSDGYPFKGISGTAVIWKAMQAYARTYGTPQDERMIDHLIVLVGISTISDVMPLIDENRYIIQKSVERLQDATFLRFGAQCDGYYGAVFQGLYALHQVCDANKKFDYGFDEMTLGFVFGPMLNSPRRMSGSSKLGFSLFLADSPEEAHESAVALFGTNEERKTLMKRYSNQYFSPILPSPDKMDYLLSVVPFRGGLIGLLAGRFTSQFDLPSIVFGGKMVSEVHFKGALDHEAQPVLSGSGRSPAWFDLHGALTTLQQMHPEMFKSFGGHKQAAGVAIYTEYYPSFCQLFTDMVRARLADVEQQMVEGDVQDDTLWLNWVPDVQESVVLPTHSDVATLVDVAQFIDQLKPFGHGFDEPLFGVRFNTEDVRVDFMGAEKQHVKFTCPNGIVMIQWNGAESLRQQLGHLSGPFEFVARGVLRINEFRERKTVQLILDQLTWLSE